MLQVILTRTLLFNSFRLFSSPTPFRVHLFLMYTAAVKRVGTHNGSFHCDEALGCFMIRLTNKFSDAHVVRTRDSQVLDTLDAVLDVGGVYDPMKDRYDHHQKGFDEVFGHGFNTKLSSAGLIYKHFGKEIIAKELQVDEDHPDVQRLFLAVYKSFMECPPGWMERPQILAISPRIQSQPWSISRGNQKPSPFQKPFCISLPLYRNTSLFHRIGPSHPKTAIDAIDNGINQYDTDQTPRYVNSTHLSSRVGKLNLDWIDPDQSAEKENAAFDRAMDLAGSEFLNSIRSHARSWLPARSIVMECLAASRDIDPSGEIMVLDRLCPWKLHLFELEEEEKINPSLKYVLYQDDRSKHWRVQAVAIAPDRFESRKALPVQWRGLRDDELSKESGIPGCVFVHMSGFIGGNQTYEGAMQ